MTREDIAAVIARVPELNDAGACLLPADRKLPPDQRAARWREEQEVLLDSAEACTQVCEWLAGLKRRKTINHLRSSYGLKHIFSDLPGNPYAILAKRINPR